MIVLLATVILAALVLAACGRSSGSTSSGSSGTVKLGIFATTSAISANAYVETDPVEGAKAAVKKLNSEGGIDGHQIEFKVCNNGGDPNRDASCARQAVTEHWLATVGGDDSYAPNQTLPILESASIPYVGYIEGSAVEYQSELSFPLEGGKVVGNAALFVRMVEDGCKKPVMLEINLPGAEESEATAESIFESKPGVEGNFIPFEPTTTNFSATVTSALANEPDCVGFGGSGPQAVSAFKAIRKAGSDATLYASPAVLTSAVVPTLGSIAEGIKGVSTAPLASDESPEMKEMVAELKAYNPKVEADEHSINAYFSVMMVAQVSEGLKELTAEELLAKFQASEEVSVPPFPTINFTKLSNSKTYPRLFSPYYWAAEVKGGKWVQTSSEPVDVSSYIK